MPRSIRHIFTIAAIIFVLANRLLSQEDDVADVPSQDMRAGKDDNMRYFLIGPSHGVKMPDAGFGLIIVLPGGDGSADFHPFVKRIFKHALPDAYLVAQPVAVKWNAKQQITWTTAKDRTGGTKFSTENFVDAVIDEITKKHKLDSRHIFTLSWSSGGPAAYAISLSNNKVTGSFVAMSVFKPGSLPPLTKAKGRAYYIFHSPEDRTCPFRMAQQAAIDLEENAAKVKLVKYDGGHGWHGDIFNQIREGIDWLESNSTVPDK